MEKVDIYHDEGSIDPNLISEFENEKKIKLPKAYKSLIIAHDALRPEKDVFHFQNIFANDYSWSYKIENMIDSRDVSFLGFGLDLDNYLQIRWQDFDVYGHDYVIAFGMAANGDYICFDYRHDPSTDEPKVVVMFHDAYDENNKMLICHVADSFEGFMDLLYKNEAQ